LESLRRTQAGEFFLDQAVSAEHLGSDLAETELLARLIPMEDLLSEYPRIELSEENFRRAANGSPVTADVNELMPLVPEAAAGDSTPYIRLFSKEGRLVALGRPEPAPASMLLISQPQDPKSVWIHPVTVVL
jgi:tRNA U55 pseudouridine synthase TruB